MKLWSYATRVVTLHTLQIIVVRFRCACVRDLNSGLGKSGLKLKVSFVAENHNARQEQNDVTRHTRKKHTAQQRSKGDAAGNHGDVKHREHS